VRAYLPTTLAGLGALLDAGEAAAPVGYAVTPALREWYSEGDTEQLEYVATGAAARACLRLLQQGGGPDRRVVLAVEVPDAVARPAPDLDRAAVRLGEPVRLADVHAALVDDADAAADVRRAVDALDAAEAGDEDARLTVDDLEDHELGWYAAQELGVLVEIEG
jgi:uncharacterized protein DUF6912